MLIPLRSVSFWKILVALVAGLLAVTSIAAAEPTPVDFNDGLILVAGASGRTGHYIIKHLDEEGLPFRAMTRDRDEAVLRWGQAYADMNWMEGDARDPLQMQQMMVGVSRVICVIGSKDIEGPNGPEYVDYGGVKNLVDAAAAAGVEQFVLMTSMGVTDKRHPLNKRLGNVMTWRYKGEQVLRKSGLTYTIVRPSNLVDGPANQMGMSFYQGDKWKDHVRGTVSRDDLSFLLIEALINPDAREKTFEVTNNPGARRGAWIGYFSELQAD